MYIHYQLSTSPKHTNSLCINCGLQKLVRIGFDFISKQIGLANNKSRRQTFPFLQSRK